MTFVMILRVYLLIAFIWAVVLGVNVGADLFDRDFQIDAEELLNYSLSALLWPFGVAAMTAWFVRDAVTRHRERGA